MPGILGSVRPRAAHFVHDSCQDCGPCGSPTPPGAVGTTPRMLRYREGLGLLPPAAGRPGQAPHVRRRGPRRCRLGGGRRAAVRRLAAGARVRASRGVRPGRGRPTCGGSASSPAGSRRRPGRSTSTSARPSACAAAADDGQRRDPGPDRRPSRHRPDRGGRATSAAAVGTVCSASSCRTRPRAWPWSRPAAAPSRTCRTWSTGCCRRTTATATGTAPAATAATTSCRRWSSPSLTVPVVAGRPTLGTWQSLVLVDSNVDNAVRHGAAQLPRRLRRRDGPTRPGAGRVGIRVIHSGTRYTGRYLL